MKHFFKAFILLVALVVSLNNLNIDAMAYLPALPFDDFGYLPDSNYILNKYTEIWKDENIEKDFTLKEDQNITIRPLMYSKGRLVIKNGVEAELKGTLFIERGGTLEIENGTVIINGGTLQNCGTIIIGKNGKLHIRNGQFCSTAAGTIINNGRITCMDNMKNLNSTFKSIKKYDKNFDLSDYALSIIGHSGNEADVTLNYCINDVKTDYTYKFTLDVNKKRIKIKRKAYSFETVYNSDTKKNILERKAEFEKKQSVFPDYGYWKDYGYTFNYRTNEMIYDATWYTYDFYRDLLSKETHSEKI